MTTFLKSILAAGLMCGASGAAFAAAHAMDVSTMTCGDLMAMDEAGQMTAMEGLHMAMEEDAMADGATSEGDAAMAEGDAAMAEGDAAMAEGDAAMMDEDMTAMMTACEGNPDKSAMDAMGEMSSN